MCVCMMHNLVQASVFFEKENILQATVLSQTEFATDYCTVTNTDSSLHSAVLSETQTVKQFIIQLLFTSVIQCQL